LIDEYQDTDDAFAGAVLKHFVAAGTGPLVGFFGDHWQKIYGTGCGQIEHPSLEVIGKESNFRSVSAIVNVLNQMRPELPQAVTTPEAVGAATGLSHQRMARPRETGDTAAAICRDCESRISWPSEAMLAKDGWDFSPQFTKILMLTHRCWLPSKATASWRTSSRETNRTFKKKMPTLPSLSMSWSRFAVV